MDRIIDRIKRMIKDLYYYVRQNPVKVLLPIVMALISGGALHAVARKFGITLPAALAGRAGGRGGGFDFERAFEGGGGRSASGLGDLANGGVLKSAIKIASTFL